jgi:hypothetical protein
MQKILGTTAVWYLGFVQACVKLYLYSTIYFCGMVRS